jgi:hypothetical protein
MLAMPISRVTSRFDRSKINDTNPRAIILVAVNTSSPQ